MYFCHPANLNSELEYLKEISCRWIHFLDLHFYLQARYETAHQRWIFPMLRFKVQIRCLAYPDSLEVVWNVIQIRFLQMHLSLDALAAHSVKMSMQQTRSRWNKLSALRLVWKERWWTSVTLACWKAVSPAHTLMLLCYYGGSCR